MHTFPDQDQDQDRKIMHLLHTHMLRQLRGLVLISTCGKVKTVHKTFAVVSSPEYKGIIPS